MQTRNNKFRQLIIPFCLYLFLILAYLNPPLHVQTSTSEVGKIRNDLLTERRSLGTSEGDLLWNRTYGSSRPDIAYAITQTTDGGFAFAGRMGDDMWLMKTNARGELQFTRIYDDNNRQENAFAVVQTMECGFAFAGSTRGLETSGWVVKTNAIGDIEWVQTYGGAGGKAAHALIETTDGGFAIAGAFYITDIRNLDIWLVKTDALGDMQWNQTYGNSQSQNINSILQTTDGGFVLVGSTESYGAGSSEFWLVKTDALGNMQWNQTYGGALTDHAKDVIQTTDGGFVLVGSTQSYGAGEIDIWLVKTNGSGEMEWNQTYGGAYSDVAHRIIQTADGGFALAGHTRSYGAGKYDMWLVKTDALGEVQWWRTYGGPEDDEAFSLAQKNDRSFILAGATLSYGVGARDIWLIGTVPAPPEISLISPQNSTYTTQVIPVYASNATPVDTAWWRYWNGTWSANQTMTWNGADSHWEGEGLNWTEGSYQIQVFCNNSVGDETFAVQWFRITTSIALAEFSTSEIFLMVHVVFITFGMRQKSKKSPLNNVR